MTKELEGHIMELVIVTEVAVQLTVVTSQNAKMTEHIMKDPFNSTFAQDLKRDEEENSKDKIQNFIAIQNPKFYAKVMPRLESNRENDIFEKKEFDVALSGLLTSYSDIDIDPTFQCDDTIEKRTNQILAFKNENYQTELEQEITEHAKDEIENEKSCEMLHVRKSYIEQNDQDELEAPSLRIENMNDSDFHESDDSHVQSNVTDNEINDKCLTPVLLASKTIISDLCVQQKSLQDCYSTGKSFQSLSEEKKGADNPEYANDNKNNVNPNKQKESLSVIVEQENNVSLTQLNVNQRYTGEEISSDVDYEASSSTCYHEHKNLNMATFDLQAKNSDKGKKKEDKFELIGKTNNRPKWASVIQTRKRKREEGSNVNPIDEVHCKKQKGRSTLRINLSKKKKNMSKNMNNNGNTQNRKKSKKEISDPSHDKIESSSINQSENEFYCKVCSLTLASKASLQRHKTDPEHKEKERLERKNERFPCDICGKDFVRKSGMVWHRKIHTDMEKPYPCEICGKTFRLKSSMKTHTLIHTNKFDFHCDICPKECRHKSDLTIHIKTHSGKKEHWCKVCNKGFLRKSNMENHMQLHTGIRSFICEYCGKGFNSKTNLKTHMRLHTEDGQFKCDTCGKRFTQKPHLERHARIHTGEKPFICETCGFQTADPSTLRSHLRRHTGERPYECNICGKRFNKSSILNRHIECHKRGFRKRGRKVSNEVKIFPCLICNSSFSKNSRLTRHMKTVHAKMSEKNRESQTIQKDKILRRVSRHANSTSYISTEEHFLQSRESVSTTENLGHKESSDVNFTELNQSSVTNSEQLEMTQSVEEIFLGEEQIIDTNTEIILVTYDNV